MRGFGRQQTGRSTQFIKTSAVAGSHVNSKLFVASVLLSCVVQVQLVRASARPVTLLFPLTSFAFLAHACIPRPLALFLSLTHHCNPLVQPLGRFLPACALCRKLLAGPLSLFLSGTGCEYDRAYSVDRSPARRPTH